MKLHSFRLRIALLSAALAGSALVGFGGIAWKLIYAAQINSLDAQLENLIRRAARPRPPDFWPTFEDSLSTESETSINSPIAFLVTDPNGTTQYQSKNWSVNFQVHNLVPLPDRLPNDPPIFKKGRFRAEHQERNDIEPHPRYSPNGVWNPPKIVTQTISTGSWRVGVANSVHSQIAIAVSLGAIEQEMTEIRNMFLIAISGILLLVSGGAWMISGSALRPIQDLTTAIKKVTATGLDQTVPIDTANVEFIELIQVFNQMLERLGRSFKQASRFSADAAHELKTPLAILQGEIEQALYQAEPGSENQQSLSNLLDEVRRLSSIVRKLLLLSLADAGQMNLHKVEVNLSEMLTVIIEDMEMLAPMLKVKTAFSENLRVWGDRDLLTQVLQNLMGNAIKYNVPEGWISIQAQQLTTTVSVTIANSSSENLVVDCDRIFERFYRGDTARTRKIEGVGLGLSLSREIIRAHQGSLTLAATPVGQTAFTLVLPRALIQANGEANPDIVPYPPETLATPNPLS